MTVQLVLVLRCWLYHASVGTGIFIMVDPAVSTTYYVRAEGDCNNTNAVSQLVTVRVPSTDPTGYQCDQ